MTKRPDITVFLPSGCLSLKSIQKYQDGGYSKKERDNISQHLKKCRFCSEAMEGLLLIPDPFEQRAMVKSIRQGLFQNIRNRGNGQSKRFWPGRKSNIAAIVAGIVLLVGVFSTYSYLLKRDNDFLAEENLSSEKIESMKEFIPKSDEEKKSTVATEKIITKEKPLTVDKKEQSSKNTKSKTVINDFREADTSQLGIIEDEEILSLKEEPSAYMLNTKEDPYISERASQLAKSSKIEIPKLKTEALPQTNKKNKSSTIQALDSEGYPDSLKSPVFKSKKYNSFNDYILKNLKKSHAKLIIPENKKIEVSFLITSEGKIQNVYLIKGIDTEIDNKIKKLIENSPPWTPATLSGKNMKYKMFIKIELQEVRPKE